MKVRITDIHHSDAHSYNKEEFIGKMFEVFEGFTPVIGEDGWSNLKVYHERLPHISNYFYKVKYDIVEDRPVSPLSLEYIFKDNRLISLRKDIRIGDRLRHIHRDTVYIVASPDKDNVVLINIDTGFRFTFTAVPAPAKDVVLTKDEVIALIGGNASEIVQWEKVADGLDI